MKKLSVVLLCSSVLAGPAFAAEDEGLYVGANAGFSGTNYVGSTSSNAFTLQLGYQVTQNLAVEAQYGYLGNFDSVLRASAAAGTFDISSVSAAAVLRAPFGARWAGYAKLGLANTAVRISGSGAAGFDGTFTETGFTYGIGAQFNFNPSFGLRFGWDAYAVGGTSPASPAANGVLGMVYVGVINKF